MIVIIPLGGIGERFKQNGYKRPKALINLYGSPIITYLINNINTELLEYIFIPYNREYKEYRIEDYLTKLYPNIVFKFHCIEKNTRGAVETINTGLQALNETRSFPVLCLDCDNFYNIDIVSAWNGENKIFTVEDHGNEAIYSYILTDKTNKICEIVEKVKISANACTGAYGFSSVIDLQYYTEQVIKANILDHSEFYTSCVIKKMIEDNIVFYNHEVKQNDYICVGTPLQLKMAYLHNNINIKPKRICFDLDNTLVTYPIVQNDYTTVQPITKNIKFLTYLKMLGNTIIIYTARKMKSENGNIGKVNANIGKITFDTLEKYNIYYDEIYFGKPYADFYIDDLGINCFDSIDKELGYYNNKINPRSFHELHETKLETITKKGNMRGEYYYYNNIPKEIKDLFPVYLSGCEYYIVIEKIVGTTITDIYLSELLTKDLFHKILESIKCIHNSVDNPDPKINIYQNYKQKMTERYKNYDYSKFANSEKYYKNLLSKLEDYENKQYGKPCVIHGDPVFTNILLTKTNKIKFIDMRGKVGNQYTIYGDWLYDWAKIYQSLLGYDEIMLNKTLPLEYKNGFIEYFKKYFIENYSLHDFENLELITKSLLFTLLPLHDNDKCFEYYSLINF
jgi:capsule biosynthesis phosphatase